MKKIILILVISCINFLSFSQSKPNITITGNNIIHHPYNDNEPLTLSLSNLIPNETYIIGFPTNYIIRDKKPDDITEGLAMVLIPSGTTATVLFNAPTSSYWQIPNLSYIYTTNPTWYLPPNLNVPSKQHNYFISIRVWYDWHISKAYFFIQP